MRLQVARELRGRCGAPPPPARASWRLQTTEQQETNVFWLHTCGLSRTTDTSVLNPVDCDSAHCHSEMLPVVTYELVRETHPRENPCNFSTFSKQVPEQVLEILRKQALGSV